MIEEWLFKYGLSVCCDEYGYWTDRDHMNGIWCMFNLLYTCCLKDNGFQIKGLSIHKVIKILLIFSLTYYTAYQSKQSQVVMV